MIIDSLRPFAVRQNFTTCKVYTCGQVQLLFIKISITHQTITVWAAPMCIHIIFFYFFINTFQDFESKKLLA